MTLLADHRVFCASSATTSTRPVPSCRVAGRGSALTRFVASDGSAAPGHPGGRPGDRRGHDGARRPARPTRLARFGGIERAVCRAAGQRFEREPKFQAVRQALPGPAIDRCSRYRPRALRSADLRAAAEQFQRGIGRANPGDVHACCSPGGTLSFFEYIAVRPARAMVSGAGERARLRGVGAALHRLLSKGEIRRDWVWPNVPPAWVHHVEIHKA